MEQSPLRSTKNQLFAGTLETRGPPIIVNIAQFKKRRVNTMAFVIFLSKLVENRKKIGNQNLELRMSIILSLRLQQRGTSADDPVNKIDGILQQHDRHDANYDGSDYEKVDDKCVWQ